MITNDRIDTSGPAQRRRLDSYDARKEQNMRVPSLSAEAGFDAAVRAIEGWADGFFGGRTKEKLQAVARDLKSNRTDILRALNRRPE